MNNEEKIKILMTEIASLHNKQLDYDEK
jgi:hypothetical protein